MKISIYVRTLWQYYYVETVPAPTRVTKSSGFQHSGSKMLDFWKLKKYNKLVKNYFQMKFESADLIYQPRGIQKCNKMGGISDSTKRYGFWKKSSMNRSGVFYNRAFGAPDKGQMLDVCQGQTAESGLRILWGGRLTTSLSQRRTAGPNAGLGIPT